MSHLSVTTQVKQLVGESVIASSAATLSLVALEVPVWAMFIGWISFFTRGLNLKSGLINLACVMVGILTGIAAAHAIGSLSPHLGSYAIFPVVFAVTMFALSLRRAPLLNNLLGLFLGLVAYFASHLPPNAETFGVLTLATALGALAGYLAHLLHNKTAHNSAAQ